MLYANNFMNAQTLNEMYLCMQCRYTEQNDNLLYTSFNLMLTVKCCYSLMVNSM